MKHASYKPRPRAFEGMTAALTTAHSSCSRWGLLPVFTGGIRALMSHLRMNLTFISQSLSRWTGPLLTGDFPNTTKCEHNHSHDLGLVQAQGQQQYNHQVKQLWQQLTLSKGLKSPFCKRQANMSHLKMKTKPWIFIMPNSTSPTALPCFSSLPTRSVLFIFSSLQVILVLHQSVACLGFGLVFFFSCKKYMWISLFSSVS